MKRHNLKRKLEISAEVLTNLGQEQVMGGTNSASASGCYNTTSAMRVHGNCIPATPPHGGQKVETDSDKFLYQQQN